MSIAITVTIHALCRDCGQEQRMTWRPAPGPIVPEIPSVGALARDYGWFVDYTDAGRTRCGNCVRAHQGAACYDICAASREPEPDPDEQRDTRLARENGWDTFGAANE